MLVTGFVNSEETTQIRLRYFVKKDFCILRSRTSVFWESWFCEAWGSMHLQVALEQTKTSSLSLPTRCPLKSCQATTCFMWQGRMVPASTANNVRSRRSPPDYCNPWNSPCNLSMAIYSQQVAIVFSSTYARYSLPLAVFLCFFWQRDSSYTIVMFVMCFYVFFLC